MPDLQPSEVSSSVWQSMHAARRRRRRGQNWMTMRGERDAVLVVSDDTFSSSMRCLPCLFSVATDRSFAVFFLVHIAIWYFPAHVHIARMLSLSLSLPPSPSVCLFLYMYVYIYIYVYVHMYIDVYVCHSLGLCRKICRSDASSPSSPRGQMSPWGPTSPPGGGEISEFENLHVRCVIGAAASSHVVVLLLRTVRLELAAQPLDRSAMKFVVHVVCE